MVARHEGVRHESYVRLTSREIEIVKHVAHGLTAKEVGRELEIAPRTVQKHVEHIFMKMRAKNKAHMVGLALALGFIGQNEILSEPIAPF